MNRPGRHTPRQMRALESKKFTARRSCERAQERLPSRLRRPPRARGHRSARAVHSASLHRGASLLRDNSSHAKRSECDPGRVDRSSSNDDRRRRAVRRPNGGGDAGRHTAHAGREVVVEACRFGGKGSGQLTPEAGRRPEALGALDDGHELGSVWMERERDARSKVLTFYGTWRRMGARD